LGDSLLRAEDLRYAYPDGTPALRGLSLAIAAGEKVGLVGANGSGKSTLLMCLSGLFKATGRMRVESHDVTAPIREAPGRLGLVFQNPDDQLFMPTVADDLAFGPINLGLPDSEVHQRVHEAAEAMGIDPLLDRPPHHLSMGQKRSAAIAAVLAMRPGLLLLDEPSSNLDPRSRRQLIEVLGRLPAAMLIASQDLSLIDRLCARVIVLEEGRVAADGGTRELLRDSALMERHGLEAWGEARG
jgi:cobalt/nickel transport system ATP-binding protein